MALKASVNSGLSLQHRVSNFLLNYRSTPHATTGVSPASLFLHRHIRTRMDLLRPECESRVLAKQTQQKTQHDKRAQEREFCVGQSVVARNMRPGPDWVPAVVKERLGPLTYLVETTERLLWKRHVDLLRELTVRKQLETLDAEMPDSQDWDVPAPELPLVLEPDTLPAVGDVPPPAPVAAPAATPLPAAPPAPARDTGTTPPTTGSTL